MSFSFLKPESLKQQYEKAKAAFLPNFSSFDEYERIVAAEPKNHKEGQPDVTDATTASFIETRPRAIVQQPPTGKVALLSLRRGDSDLLTEASADTEDLLGELLDNVILPNATTGGAVINKAITAVRKGMIYGAQPALCFVRNDDTYFGADFQLLNIRDVFFETGKSNAKDCNYMFLTSYYTEGDIEAIISGEKELAKDKDYKTPWNLKLLAEMKGRLSGKEEDSKSYTDSQTQEQNSVYVKLVHAFQRGKGALFYTFDPESGEVIRKWENPDPRGIIPIHYFYYDQDTNKPLGNSAIRLTVRLQNMLDMHFQNYQHAVGVKSAPPTKVRGGIDMESIKFEPFAIWDMGDDPNADASIVNTDNTLINTFPQTQGILKSNILNITNNGDTSVSAEIGNPGFSKTPAGVRAQQNRVDVNDNYLRRQFEEFYSDILTTMLNLHIAAHIGAKEKDVVPLSKRFIELKRKQDPHYDEKTDEVDYEKLGNVIAKFKVDASSSKIDDDQKQLETLNNLLEIRARVGDVIEPFLRIGPLVRQIIKKSGVQNIDDISPRESEMDTFNLADQGELTLQQTPPEAAPAEMGEAMNGLPQEPPVVLEEAAGVQTTEKPTESEMELMKLLEENGLSTEQAVSVLGALENGADPEELDNILRELKQRRV